MCQGILVLALIILVARLVQIDSRLQQQKIVIHRRISEIDQF